ncbi:bifunctional DNA primase/polymerase [Mycolicibacterium iranicum]|uniref:bifunctional DNA primase/polymerase n=1 Tax=Mycolicibacterium iranicum TaxID=912594 RepID=UPI000464903F|nr:bifunctional DNA primase/polymerase [Mycolicibacterium iranicum]
MSAGQKDARTPSNGGAGSPLETMLALGFSVGPLSGKVPLTRHGVADFTCDRAVITRWARQHPGCNWGCTKLGIVCLDVDPRSGGSVAALKLRPEHETLTIRTGGGGWHLYYRHTGLVRGKVAGTVGIDVKAGGKGYLVAPGSIHPVTGKPYRIHRGGPIADLPEHLQALIEITAPTTKLFTAVNNSRAQGDRWDGLVRSVAEAQQGERNSMLFWAAARAAADSAPAAVYSALAVAAHEIGLGAHEIHQTIQSGQRKGAA